MNLTIRTAQLRAMADAGSARLVQACADTATWIEIALVDTDGAPVGGEAYEVRLPDQSVHTGQLDPGGRVRFDGILPGTAAIRFPAIDGRDWRSM